MSNPTPFETALTEDIYALSRFKLQPLSATAVYLPYFKIAAKIYLLLCAIAVGVVKLSVLVGFLINQPSLLRILQEALFYNLIPVFFLMVGLSQGFMLWRIVQSQLTSAPYIVKSMRYILGYYCLLYTSLLLVEIALFQMDDVAEILRVNSILSLSLFLVFLNRKKLYLEKGVMCYFLQGYCLIYTLLFVVGITLFQQQYLTLLLMGYSVISSMLCLVFFNMERQRLSEDQLIKQLEKLVALLSLFAVQRR